MTDSSLAAELAILVAATPMSELARWRFFEIATRVRRIELALDEVVDNARQEAVLAGASENVVHVDFVRTL